MIISVNAKNLKKLLSSIENLFLLNQQLRVKPQVFVKILELFFEMIESSIKKKEESNIEENNKAIAREINFYKKRIINVFEKYNELDGLKSEIYDIYVFFIEKCELSTSGLSTERKEVFYKQIIEIRMKQIRCLTVTDWEANGNFKQILEACGYVEKELIKVSEKEKEYKLHVSKYIESIKKKIKDIEESKQ